MSHFPDLPVELIVDNILPLLPTQDLLSLSSTNRSLYTLASDGILWKNKLEEDFNFPVSETARTVGWKFLYERLSRPKLYVWGESSQGRLGVLDNALPRTSVSGGVPYPIPLELPGVRIVSIIAGGMSFHAIDSKGAVYVWGTLDGTRYALQVHGFADPSQRARVPLKLKLPCAMRNISCARLYSAGLDTESTVWTFTSWGRPFRLVSPLVDKTTPDSTPMQVECGWGFTSILTQSGDVLVYWPSNGTLYNHLYEKNTQLDGLGESTRAKLSTVEPGVVPCHVWDMDAVSPVRLPPIPADTLPPLSGTKAPKGINNDETKLVRIAGMDNSLIGLTNKGHVLQFNMLNDETSYGDGRWKYLPYFSEAQKVNEDQSFSENAKPRLKPLDSMRITHISAHFKTFIAYSTGSQSVVLMGRDMDIETNESIKPTIIPSLQYQSVIAVTLGDYHYGALTSTGKLLTWGEFSNGALGLGDPVNIEPGKPGGFRNANERRAVIDARTMHMPFTPPTVRDPVEVSFNHGVKKPREKFCFAVTAAGWHTGALVVDLEPGNEPEEDESQSVPGAFPSEDTSNPEPRNPHTIPFIGAPAGMRPFRIGFPGRGR